MGVAERRDREREEVRRKILDAARELFVAEGYERVTMRRIAEAIEYSPTTIYSTSRTRTPCVELALRGRVRPAARRLLGTGSRPRDRGRPGSGSSASAYARFGLEYPNHYRFMFMTPGAFGRDHRAQRARPRRPSGCSAPR